MSEGVELRALEAFLIEEAHFLDTGRFQDWLALWSPEGRYWMPCDHGETDTAFGSAIINDDRAALALRVARLAQANAHSVSPFPVACRMVSNVAIESFDPLVVRSKLICHEIQHRRHARDDYRMFCATVRHHLVGPPADWKILKKHVLLIDSGGARTVMPIPL